MCVSVCVYKCVCGHRESVCVRNTNASVFGRTADVAMLNQKREQMAKNVRQVHMSHIPKK